MQKPRYQHSGCSYLSRYMIVTGGSIRIQNGPGSVEKFDTWMNKWHELPSLIQGRDRHSSCCVKDSIYVFCGVQVSDDSSLSSIEELNLAANGAFMSSWRLIELPDLGSRINLGIAHV